MAGNRTIHSILAESQQYAEDLKSCIERLRSMDRAGFPGDAYALADTARISATAINRNMTAVAGAFGGQMLRHDRRMKAGA